MSNHRKNRAKRHLQIVQYDFMDIVDYIQTEAVCKENNLLVKKVKTILIGLISDLQTQYPFLIKRSLKQHTSWSILEKLDQLYHFHIPLISNPHSFPFLLKMFIKSYDDMVVLIDSLHDNDWDLPVHTNQHSYKHLTIEDVFCLLIPSAFENQCLEIIRLIEVTRIEVN